LAASPGGLYISSETRSGFAETTLDWTIASISRPKTMSVLLVLDWWTSTARVFCPATSHWGEMLVNSMMLVASPRLTVARMVGVTAPPGML
jgi:hypothetical protein